MGGNKVPIKGHVLIDLIIGTIELTPFHNWVRTCDLPNFTGIIGTDVLNNLSAMISCSDQLLIMHIKGKVEQVLLGYINHIPEFAQIHTVNPKAKFRKINKANQVIPVVKRNQVIPPRSHS